MLGNNITWSVNNLIIVLKCFLTRILDLGMTHKVESAKEEQKYKKVVNWQNKCFHKYKWTYQQTVKNIHTWTQRVAIGLPLARKWKNSVEGFSSGAFGSFLLPFLMTNIRLKCERNLRFSCCWWVLTTSNLSPKRDSNFFCKL